jgi:hypothetical protein
MKRKIAILATIAITFLTIGCPGKGGGGGLDTSLLLLGLAVGSSANSGSQPCIQKRELTVPVVGSTPDFYDTGKTLFWSDMLSYTAGPNNPNAIVYFEQDHGFTGADFRPTLYFFYGNASYANFFNNREGILAGQHATSMHSYGSNSYFYLATGSFITPNPAFLNQRIGLDLNGPVNANFSYKEAISCNVPASEDRNFFTSGGSSSTNGLNKVWTTRKKLNVNIIFLPNSYVTQTLDAIQPALDRFKEVYAQSTVGIDLNFKVTISTNTEFSSITDVASENKNLPGGLIRLYTSTGDLQDPNALNIYFASEADGIAGLLGIAGGIPGLPGFVGTKASGMVVFTESHRSSGAVGTVLSNADLTFIGNTIAHEAGHFLGLFHVNERTGATNASAINYVEDPLIETPKCMAANNVNGNGVVDISECLGTGFTNSGALNLMFWAGDGVTNQSQLTGEQGWVLRRNPLAY